MSKFSDFGFDETQTTIAPQPTAAPKQTFVLGRRVANQFPTITNQPYRIAVIGEAPGNDEEHDGRPFVGMSGRLLNQLLAKANVLRDACFVGNICQHRPPSNDITFFSPTGETIKDGLDRLTQDLCSFNPNVVLLLGKTALSYAKGTDKITDWRGSLFIGDIPGPFFGRKCIASFHPAACLRQWEWSPLLTLDIKKAKSEGTSPELNVPFRDLRVNLTTDQILHELAKIKHEKPLIAIDIEGWVHSLTCISIARSATDCFIVPFTKLNGSNYYETIDEEVLVWRALSDILSDGEIHKVLQNSLYDRFVLQYAYQCPVLGVRDDTMLRHWELYCELEKSLGFQCSLYTSEPYYKGERKSDDLDTFYKYCCRDSSVTYEINDKLSAFLNPSQNNHYQFNIALLNPLLFMELKGIRYDETLAKQRKIEVEEKLYTLQYELDTLCGRGLDPNLSGAEVLEKVRSALCYKRDPTQPKKGNEKPYRWAEALVVGGRALTKADRGRLNTICDVGLNIKSKQFKDYLYTTLKLPKQYTGEPPHLSTNYEALIKLQKAVTTQEVTIALDLGELRTRSQMLEISADNDGRIRAGYNLVGTETGRLTCYTSPTGSGYNLQTIPAESSTKPKDHPLHFGMRDLFVADKGYYIFQCDLSGADGWTVGAYMASLGDSTMLDDLRAGIKPAQSVCYLFRHGPQSLNGKSRGEVKDLLREVKKEDWDYFFSKIGIWGTCYLMGVDKLANQIAIQSEGKVWLSRNDTRDFQNAVFARYRVRVWHNWMERQLRQKPELIAPNGFKRRFFGRDREILGQALAHMPQVITTWATNMAMYNLWRDEQNRYESPIPMVEGPTTAFPDFSAEESHTQPTFKRHTKLKIQPLHQVHDALIGQFKQSDTTWAVGRIKSYFDNPITVAGITLTIPFEGQYGHNWALDEKSKVGTI